MKIKELIEILQKHDPEAEIVITHMDCDPYDSWNDREIKNDLTERMISIGRDDPFYREYKGKLIIDLEKDY